MRTVFADSARKSAVDAMIRAGLAADRADAMRELEDVIAEFSSNYGGHFDKVLDRLGPEAFAGHNRAVIVAAGVVAYHETKWRELKVHDDVYEVLEWLATTSLVRGIVSAGITIKQAEKLVRLGILGFLSPDAIFFTDQVGFSKPNPKIFPREDIWQSSWDVGVNLTWTFFDSGRTRAEMAEAAAATRATEERQKELGTVISADVRQRLLDLRSSRASVRAADAGVRAAAEARRVLGERFAVGVATTTDVLVAQEQLLTAELARARALAGVRLAEARLQRALGRP